MANDDIRVLSDDQISALGVLSFIVGMIEFEIEEGYEDFDDDTRLFQYSHGGASGFFTLGHARALERLLHGKP